MWVISKVLGMWYKSVVEAVILLVYQICHSNDYSTTNHSVTWHKIKFKEGDSFIKNTRPYKKSTNRRTIYCHTHLIHQIWLSLTFIYSHDWKYFFLEWNFYQLTKLRKPLMNILLSWRAGVSSRYNDFRASLVHAYPLKAWYIASTGVLIYLKIEI